MHNYSIETAEKMDAKATPNATDFANTLRAIAAGLRPEERRVFYAGAIRAAELCGKHTFAFHILPEQWRVCNDDGYHATPEAAALVERYNRG